MLFSEGKDDKKKVLYFDVNDILFSTEYIMLQNIDDFSREDHRIAEAFDVVLDALSKTGMSVFQSIIHRKEEFIITHEEFENVMAYAINRNLVNDQQILLETPYSNFMKNLHMINLQADIVFLYDNIMEETLIKARCGGDILKGVKFESTNDFLEKSIHGIQAGISGIYTARTRVIDTLIEKKVPISIMYPNTLKYLKKYNDIENCGAIQNLWNHVE
jgi:hypothetical protein